MARKCTFFGIFEEEVDQKRAEVDKRRGSSEITIFERTYFLNGT